jgi:hypothetical protein
MSPTVDLPLEANPDLHRADMLANVFFSMLNKR